MSKLFEVEFTVRAVVVADDEVHAYSVALNHAREIMRDDPLEDIDVGRAILERSHLPTGWDANCYPYGCRADKTIADHLAESSPDKLQKENTRCT
jgi:hypothetical protein